MKWHPFLILITAGLYFLCKYKEVAHKKGFGRRVYNMGIGCAWKQKIIQKGGIQHHICEIILMTHHWPYKGKLGTYSMQIRSDTWCNCTLNLSENNEEIFCNPPITGPLYLHIYCYCAWLPISGRLRQNAVGVNYRDNLSDLMPLSWEYWILRAQISFHLLCQL